MRVCVKEPQRESESVARRQFASTCLSAGRAHGRPLPAVLSAARLRNAIHFKIVAGLLDSRVLKARVCIF